MDTLTRRIEFLQYYVEEQKHFYTGEGDALFIEIEKYECYEHFEDSYYNRHQTIPLILAILSENITIVKKLLLAGADINFVDEFNYQPLLYALVINSTDIVELLLEYGANKEANFIDDDGSQVSYFQRVCEVSNKEIVKLFLDYGCNVNTKFFCDTWKYPNDCRPLHLSVIYKSLEILKLLISYKADVNMTNEAGDTALHIACEINFTEAVIELLNANALLNIKSKNYLTPLYKCVKNKNFETMKLLLAHGLNLDGENSETLLNLCTQLEVAISNGYIKILEDCLNCGLDVNKKFFSQKNKIKTLLHAAVEYDQEAVISLLLKFNASIIVKDGEGSLPLHIAAKMGKLNVIKQLLQHDLKFQASPKFSTLHAMDNTYWTPLHKACMSHVVECVEYLLECGAEVGAENGSSETSLHIACKNGCACIVKVLLEAGADPLKGNYSGQTALGQAIAVNSKECVEVLLENGLDVNVKENRLLFWDLLRTPSVEKCDLAGAFLRHGFVPEPSVSHASIKLFFAVTSQYIEPLILLIQEGADVNATFAGQSFLHVATACRYYDGVKALIAAGADVFARNADGRFAIYYAFHPGGEQLVHLFLDSGLNPRGHPELYHYPILGFTDLVHSCNDREKLATQEQDYVKMLSQLENQGADVNYCDDEGQNAMHLLFCLLRTRHENIIDREIVFDENFRCISDGDTKNGIALFDYLLRRVNLNAKTRRGEGPLHLAVELHNMPNLVKAMLPQLGLYLDSRDVFGKSALHLAYHYRLDKLISLLIELGADVNKPSADGSLPFNHHNIDVLPEFEPFPYLRRLVELHEAGLQLQASNVEYLSQFKIDKPFIKYCRDELENLDRLCQLGTVRDLFAVPEHRLARLARHPDLLRLQFHFSVVYQSLLNRRLEQAVWRAGLIDEATQAFDAIVRSFGCSLPGDCIEAVFEYLTDYELEGFCRAAHANAQETAKLYQQLTDNILNTFKIDLTMNILGTSNST